MSDGILITESEFKALTAVLMCNDDVNDPIRQELDLVEEFADRVAKHNGHDGWIDSYLNQGQNFCLDVDGNKVKAGDAVMYYPFAGCKGEGTEGKIQSVSNMNVDQENMPYIKGRGAYNPKAIRKITS